GTGRSALMDCPLQEDQELEGAPKAAVETAVARCLAQLPHDPRWFTTDVAVDDLERVRQALKITRWNIYGISYGTRVALHYLSRFPDTTRAVILDGVVARDRVLGPDIALRSQETLERILARCESDPACARAFPEISKAPQALVTRLSEKAEVVRVPSPTTGRVEERELTLDGFRGVLRLLAYRAESQALIPALLHEARARDNFVPLAAQAEWVAAELGEDLAFGMHNAVICSEDAPQFPDAKPQGLDGTYLGAGQYEYLRQACSFWPVGPVHERFREPVRSEVPVMLLSGELDPITPPQDASRTARTLANSIHLIAPGQGHGVAGSGCIPGLIAEFLDAERPQTIDTGCAQRLAPLPFAIELNGPLP
ncbi:MAG: alpha/beta hydrolase, partial [Myxococcota bacterium]